MSTHKIVLCPIAEGNDSAEGTFFYMFDYDEEEFEGMDHQVVEVDDKTYKFLEKTMTNYAKAHDIMNSLFYAAKSSSELEEENQGE